MSIVRRITDNEIIADSIFRTVVEQDFFANDSAGGLRILDSSGVHIGNGVILTATHNFNLDLNPLGPIAANLREATNISASSRQLGIEILGGTRFADGLEVIYD